MKVCYTALFGNYEELKTPKVVTPGWDYICFTDQEITDPVWQIVKVPLDGRNPQKLSRMYKIVIFKVWEQSIWIDASFLINTDLNAWWNKFFKKGFSASRHPIRNCIYAEGEHCIKINRGAAGIAEQLAEYKTLGIPRNNGVITSGLLMRENTAEVIALCNQWWKETATHSIRDQVSFGKVSLGSNVLHTYQWDYRQSPHFIYRKHYHYRK